jgi:hypothetical protein
MVFTTIDVAVLLLAVVSFAYVHSRTKRRLPTPPGPKGWPIIGALFEIPPTHAWKTYAQWGEIYGK